jgi:hypothetical protein
LLSFLEWESPVIFRKGFRVFGELALQAINAGNGLFIKMISTGTISYEEMYCREDLAK